MCRPRPLVWPTTDDLLALTIALATAPGQPAAPPAPVTTSHELLRRTVLVTAEQRRRVRVEAAARDVTVSDVVIPAVDRLIGGPNRPAVSPAGSAAAAWRTSTLTVTAPRGWWDRLRIAAARLDVAQHDLIHAALTSRHQ